MIEIILCQLPHLLEKIDIVLTAAITLMGFMIAALAILKVILPKPIEELSGLKKDIFNVFRKAISFLIGSSILATIAFFFNELESMEYMALASFIVFIISLVYVYKAVDIIFILEDTK